MNNVLRITSGKFKGRKILTPGGKTHPMGERERIALFNMISGFIPGSRVVDVFSGSGALGIEALSRGADEVVFIEKNTGAYETIRQNLSDLEVNDGVEALKTDAYKFSEETTEKYDIVIADPPYDEYDGEKIKLRSKLVGELGGILVLSHPNEAPEMPGLKLDRTRSYANANISIYTR